MHYENFGTLIQPLVSFLGFWTDFDLYAPWIQMSHFKPFPILGAVLDCTHIISFSTVLSQIIESYLFGFSFTKMAHASGVLKSYELSKLRSKLHSLL